MKGRMNMTLLYEPEEKCKQAIIFALVSTKDQFVNGASIPVQIQKMILLDIKQMSRLYHIL